MNAAQIAIQGIKTSTDLVAFNMAMLRESFANFKDRTGTDAFYKRTRKAQTLANRMLKNNPGDAEWTKLADELKALFEAPEEAPKKKGGKK